MTIPLTSLLDDLQMYRRQFVDQLAADLDPDIARKLGETHMAILAVEAVMTEPEPVKTGPRIIFGEDGWPSPPPPG